MPQVRAAFDFIDFVDSLTTADNVVAALDRLADEAFGLRFYGIWRLPWRYTDWDRWRLGETVFFPAHVPPEYFGRLMDGVRQHGGSALASYARRQTGPFTITQAMQRMRLSGDDRWIIDLLLEYGIRDGVYCPSRSWAALYRSGAVLNNISKRSAYALHIAATAAAAQIDHLTEEQSYFDGLRTDRIRLTPREMTVMRLLAAGMGIKAIAAQLGVNHETVRSHIRGARRKLAANSSHQAVAEAIRRELIA